VVPDEVHERQCVIGVGNGSGIVLERQPADPAVVVLQEFAIRFLALFLAELEGLPGAIAHLRLMAKVIEIAGMAVWPGAVRPIAGLDLQNAKIDAHLNDLPPAMGLHQTGLHDSRFEIPPL
jgi:hypothetical protein